jgi:hypothetical protein
MTRSLGGSGQKPPFHGGRDTLICGLNAPWHSLNPISQTGNMRVGQKGFKHPYGQDLEVIIGLFDPTLTTIPREPVSSFTNQGSVAEHHVHSPMLATKKVAMEDIPSSHADQQEQGIHQDLVGQEQGIHQDLVGQGPLDPTIPFLPTTNQVKAEGPRLSEVEVNHTQGPRNWSGDCKLPTPVKVDRLQCYLQGYPLDLYTHVIQGFKTGFSLYNYTLPTTNTPTNLKTSAQHPDIVDDKINKEVELGRIAGPFPHPPLDPLILSPMGLQPKKVPGQFRVIHHLSYPRGQSVNDGIPHECATVQYASVAQAVAYILQFGQGCYMAKTDIKAAFRIIPVRPQDYHLLGFKWRGNYYVDKCLPMGCSSSCAIFETFSTALEWIISRQEGDFAVLHILDDFLFVAYTWHSCMQILDKFLQICQDIGVPIAPEKTMGPLTALPFAGIDLDTVAMRASIPQDKIDKALHLIHEFLQRKSVTLKQIQKLTGLLNWMCGVIVTGRAFARRLYDLTKGVSKPYYRIRLNQGVKSDLMTWKLFLQEFNGKSFFLDYRWLSSQVLQLFTDAASTIGYGAVFGNKWFSGTWEPQCLGLNIAVMEMYPILLALLVWAEQFKNKCLILRSDNMAVVHVINKNTSKDNTIMILVRQLVLICLKYNILVKSQHIMGSHNVISDLLSRSQIQKAKMVHTGLEEQPTPTPEEWQLHQLLKI